MWIGEGWPRALQIQLVISFLLVPTFYRKHAGLYSCLSPVEQRETKHMESFRSLEYFFINKIAAEIFVCSYSRISFSSATSSHFLIYVHFLSILRPNCAGIFLGVVQIRFYMHATCEFPRSCPLHSRKLHAFNIRYNPLTLGGKYLWYAMNIMKKYFGFYETTRERIHLE